MPRYAVRVRRPALPLLDRLPPPRRQQVLDTLEDLANFPFFTEPHELAKLRGLADHYRIRLGDLRIIFRVAKQERTIYVQKIERREAAYR